MSRPATSRPAPDSAPEQIAELRRVRQDMAALIGHFDAEVSRFRRMDAGLCKALAALGYPEAEADDPFIRVVQGLDDVRGVVEALEPRLAAVERQQQRLAAELERLTVGVADLGGGLQEQIAHYRADSERARTAEGLCIAGVAESQRNLTAKIDAMPPIITNAVAVAVGVTLAPMAAENGERPVVYLVPARATVEEDAIHLVPDVAVEVGEGRRRRTG